MNREIFILLLLATPFIFIQSASGQKKTVYEYKYLYTIHEDGEKNTYTRFTYRYGSLHYMTFSDDNKTCYSSDENGNNGFIYGSFVETRNDMLVYRAYRYTIASGNIVDGYSYQKQWLNEYFYFSTDFSRMNYDYNDDSRQVEVYERHILEKQKHLY